MKSCFKFCIIGIVLNQDRRGTDMSIKQGDYLKKLRTENHLSQEKLAEKLGVSRQSISKWEQGYAVPDTDNVFKLSKLYGLSVDTILNCGETDGIKTDAPAENSGTADSANTNAAFAEEKAEEPPKRKRRCRLSVYCCVRYGGAWRSQQQFVEIFVDLPAYDSAVLHRDLRL